MSSSIPIELRRIVIERADGLCEYCGKAQVAYFSHEIDHIIAEKHDGQTTLENMAFACFECNRYKGSDISSIDPQTNALTPLYNPRIHQWSEHFQFNNGTILPLTPIGRVTAKLLQFNQQSRIQERILLGPAKFQLSF